MNKFIGMPNLHESLVTTGICGCQPFMQSVKKPDRQMQAASAILKIFPDGNWRVWHGIGGGVLESPS